MIDHRPSEAVTALEAAAVYGETRASARRRRCARLWAPHARIERPLAALAR